MWFWTLSKGIAKYDGNRLIYYNAQVGLSFDSVPSVKEDADGVYWLKTDDGLSSFDGADFINYETIQVPLSNMISHLFIESMSTFWVGLFTFDIKIFDRFDMP